MKIAKSFSLESVRPKVAVRLSDASESPVESGIGSRDPGSSIRVIDAQYSGSAFVDWVRANLPELEADLIKFGAVYFRGADVGEIGIFKQVSSILIGDLYEKNGEHVPVQGGGGVQTPVSYSPKKKLLWHNENTFNDLIPLRMCFCAARPADAGGETPLVDTRALYRALDEKIVAEFRERKICYVRNYNNDGIGLSWQKVFGKESREEVERQCREAGIELEWKKNGGLRTRSVRPSVARHPVTGEWSFLNQAQHWHTSCLDDETREAIEQLYQIEDFPRSCCYGDGGEIADETMAAIRDAADKLERSLPWKKGDLMFVDNIATAHARNPYQGPRSIYVSMGMMQHIAQLETE